MKEMDFATFEREKNKFREACRSRGLTEQEAEDYVGDFFMAYGERLLEDGFSGELKQQLPAFIKKVRRQQAYTPESFDSFGAFSDADGNSVSLEKRLADEHKDNLSPDVQLERAELGAGQNLDLAESLARLDDKTKYRLFVVYLRFRHSLCERAEQAPSEWPPALKEAFNKANPGNKNSYQWGRERSAEEKEQYKNVHNRRPDFEAKKHFLETQLAEVRNLLAALQGSFPAELDASGQDAFCRLYEKYYKLAKFTENPSRDVKTLLQKVFKPCFDKSDWARVEQSFQKAQLRMSPTLKKVGAAAWSERDKAILPALNITPCLPQYGKLILLHALAKCAAEYKIPFPVPETELPRLAQLNSHLASCPKCDKAYKDFLKGIEYRIGYLNKGWQRYVYRKHTFSPERLAKTRVKDCVTYYKKACKEHPSPLNNYFLDVACTLAGEKTAQSPKEVSGKIAVQKQGDVGNNYYLRVRCICGIEECYPLNNLRLDRVLFGREQNDGVLMATINVCGDDKPSLSRTMCRFEYDKEQNEWFLCADGSSEDERAKRGARIGYISFEKLKDVLSAQLCKMQEGGKIRCENEWKKAFTPLGAQRVALQDIAGIGFVQIPDGKPLFFQGRAVTGVEHPLLGKLPFGWYMDVLPRKAGAMASFLNKTILAPKTVVPVGGQADKKTVWE